MLFPAVLFAAYNGSFSFNSNILPAKVGGITIGVSISYLTARDRMKLLQFC